MAELDVGNNIINFNTIISTPAITSTAHLWRTLVSFSIKGARLALSKKNQSKPK